MEDKSYEEKKREFIEMYCCDVVFPCKLGISKCDECKVEANEHLIELNILAIEQGRKEEREKWSANMQSLWSNLSMIRDYIEHQVVGAMKPQEHCYTGNIEAEEIIKGIEKVIEQKVKEEKDRIEKAVRLYTIVYPTDYLSETLILKIVKGE